MFGCWFFAISIAQLVAKSRHLNLWFLLNPLKQWFSKCGFWLAVSTLLRRWLKMQNTSLPSLHHWIRIVSGRTQISMFNMSSRWSLTVDYLRKSSIWFLYIILKFAQLRSPPFTAVCTHFAKVWKLSFNTHIFELQTYYYSLTDLIDIFQIRLCLTNFLESDSWLISIFSDFSFSCFFAPWNIILFKFLYFLIDGFLYALFSSYSHSLLNTLKS